MEVIKLGEVGYIYAMLGTALSREQPSYKMDSVCRNLAFKQGGHNKFLEFITVWLDITAPRYWWQQMATYRIGNSWLSESTMYTLTKRHLTQDYFEHSVDENTLSVLNKYIDDKEFSKLKNELPEGFVQRRIMVTNYKSLQNIYLQRRNHRLEEWKFFCKKLLTELDHPEFLEPSWRTE